ncbi:MAG: beta-propeller domain-containing protein [Clostridia bacterium]|nr:beta-propeller domain-containing protein [Clostridia bacterium]
MFENDYRKEMDTLHADPAALEKIVEKSTRQRSWRKQQFDRTRPVLALALCLAVICGFFWMPKSPAELTPKTLSAVSTESYESIYEKIYALKKNINYVNRCGNFTTDFIAESVASDAVAKTTTTGSVNSGYSETTHQVDGVDEADFVKTDGKYIYILHQNKLQIVSADNGQLQSSSTVSFDESNNCYANEFYLSSGKAVILLNEFDEKAETNYSKITVLDLTDPKNPKTIGSCRQSGYCSTSRLIGNTLYVVSWYYVNFQTLKKDNPSTYVPTVASGNYEESVRCDTIHFCEESIAEPSYTIVCSYDIDNARLLATQSLLGGSQTIYCNTENLIVTSFDPKDYNSTVASLFSLNKGKINYETSQSLPGTLLNQFSIDEHQQHFRFVLTERTENGTVNRLQILDSKLQPVGSIGDLAPGETVYSVRFMDEYAYFVTFRQTDPLFTADLSDPKNPKIIGSLKIPGFSNYLFPYQNNKLLGIGMEADEQTGRTQCMKLSLFNISDPANVTEEDKTVLSDCNFSPALYDHRNCLVDAARNLIGFSAYRTNDMVYSLYTFDQNGFHQIAAVTNAVDCMFLRGLLIGNYFYVISDRNVRAFDLFGGMKQISSVQF